jgi:hypothetical protein
MADERGSRPVRRYRDDVMRGEGDNRIESARWSGQYPDAAVRWRESTPCRFLEKGAKRMHVLHEANRTDFDKPTCHGFEYGRVWAAQFEEERALPSGWT